MSRFSFALLAALNVSALLVGLFVAYIHFALLKNSVAAKNFYFATTEDGRLIPVPPPLEQATLGDGFITEWTPTVISEAFNWDKTTMHEMLNFMSENFTRHGWESFTTLINSNNFPFHGNLNSVASVYAKQDGPATIVNESVESGRYVWRLNVPIKIFVAGDSSDGAKLNLNVVIVRIPIIKTGYGIGIEQIMQTQ